MAGGDRQRKFGNRVHCRPRIWSNGWSNGRICGIYIEENRMTIVVRALLSNNKAVLLLESIRRYREGDLSKTIFEFEVEDLKSVPVPGTPFAYWLPHSIVDAFKTLPLFESDG